VVYFLTKKLCTMKTTLQFILSISLFFATSIFCHAQDALAEVDASLLNANKTEVKVEKEKSTLSPRQIYFNQTQMATEQLVQRLAEKITYPDHLKEQYLEGEVIIEVFINRAGVIKEAKVHKSLQKDFDQMVLTSILEMAKVNVDSLQYQGARRLRIPVNFSLR